VSALQDQNARASRPDVLNHVRIIELLREEQAVFAERHPRSRALFERGQQHFLYGAPSHWMRRWAGGFPVYVDSASGSALHCVDGLDYVDFCLGDTGGMCGHGVSAITDAITRRVASGATFMLPTEDADWVGAELARRFRLPYWGFTTSATEANRAVFRIARMVTGRGRVLVFNGCYHGSVEVAHVALADGRVVLRNGIHPNGVDHASVSRVLEFNDVAALETALAPRDVACVLAEPCMTNYGMIEAQPGFLAALRDANAAQYAAAKAGVNGFIKAAALELAPFKITVNGVEPGFVAKKHGRLSEVSVRARIERYIPLGRMGAPQEIAAAFLFLASDEACWLTGQTIVVDGGATLPEFGYAMEERWGSADIGRWAIKQ
jgi:NAD(P)-dependent dehydrogenase (short-subunit alcohol dehydrogenase family)